MSRSFTCLFDTPGLALSMLLQGCGGGGAAEPMPVASVASVASATLATTVASAASVRVEGCVVDQFYVPNEGVPVRVLSADGRTLAYTTSGRMGEFTVQVPAGVSAAVAVDRAGGEWMPTPALDRDRFVESCLVARN